MRRASYQRGCLLKGHAQERICGMGVPVARARYRPDNEARVGRYRRYEQYPTESLALSGSRIGLAGRCHAPRRARRHIARRIEPDRPSRLNLTTAVL